MSTWYRAIAWARKIDPVEVSRTTDSSVWIDGRRRAIISEGEGYFPTWDEAHQWMLFGYEAKVISARRSLEYANSLLGNVKGMKKPADAN